ncbi:hypothetical protein VE02_00892 [Pseudogymnoascus sp. 03VT05]|nr:hypothetical protein VE02_00892 [Pseudogymnoascus sp. 03VT05]
MSGQELVAYDEYRDYPFLTPDEFELACHYLESIYINANLGQARRKFKLRLQRSLTGGPSYVTIATPITIADGSIDELLGMGFLSASEGADEDMDGLQGMDIEGEDGDSDALRSNGAGDSLLDGPYVQYEIHLHPTYRTPVLWFHLHNLPNDARAFDIESVYRYLVPDILKDELRSVGVIGGISADHHPITDLPCFFMHPCNTKEAMEQFRARLSDYLMIWLGIVGYYVGLKLPLAMA